VPAAHYTTELYHHIPELSIYLTSLMQDFIEYFVYTNPSINEYFMEIIMHMIFLY